MKNLLFVILFLIFPQQLVKCEENKNLTFDTLEDFLLNSNRKVEKSNTPLVYLDHVLNTHYPNSKRKSFLLRMTNQALFLEHNKYKDHKKTLWKIELSKKLPYIKRMTDKCLRNPWSNEKNCKFEILNQNIKLLCMFDDVYKFDSPEQKVNVYLSFCWLIFSINYLEVCQVNLLIDEHSCSLKKIEIFLNLIIKKLDFLVKDKPGRWNHLEKFFKLYFDSVKDKSMEILIEILILFDHFNINPHEKLNFGSMLNKLLEDFVNAKLKFNLNYKLGDTDDKFYMKLHLIDKKINKLIVFSKRKILKHLLNSIQLINY
jgi:hypothetical protein